MLRRGTAACLLFLGIRGPCLGQQVHARDFEGSRIVSVRFQPARQPLDADELAALVPLKRGAEFRESDLRAAIQRLFRTGKYSDIAVEGRPVDGGVELLFHTSPQWFVGTVGITGNIKAPPTQGQLYAAGNLDLGRPLEADEVTRAAEQVSALLRRNGFCAPGVTPGVTRDPVHQQANIEFAVEPGERSKLRPPVVTGAPVLDPEEVAAATGWRGWFGWKPATQANVSRGLRRVRDRYQKQGRLLARVSLVDFDCDALGGEVTPTLSVYGGPQVGIETSGPGVSRGTLRKYVPVFDLGAVDRDLLTEGATNLTAYLQNKGYFNARVDYRFQRAGPDKLNIVYVIDRGQRHKLAAVLVEGNRYFSAETIREFMFIQPSGTLRLRHGRFSQGLARRDRDAIEALYQANGFRDVHVSIETAGNYRGKRNQMAARVGIVEGTQYLVGNFSITGVQRLDKADIVKNLASIPGQPFSETNVAIDRDYIIGLYNASGFPDATFNWAMTPGPGPYRVSVEYMIEEGPRQYVRDVLILGDGITRPSLVDPIVELEKGKPLSLRAMAGTQENLYNLGIFQRVGMAVQNPDGVAERKYVLYDLQEADRYRLAAGIGAEIARFGAGPTTSFENPGGATGFSPRVSFNLTRLNLWGLAHRGSLVTRLSTLEQLGSLQYLWPRFNGVAGRDVTFTALADRATYINTFTSTRLEAAGQIAQALSRASTVSGGFSYRRVGVTDLKIDPLLVPLLAQPARVGFLSGAYFFDRRDNPIDATRGIFSTFDTGVSSRIFGSQRSFTRLFGTNATYRSLRKNLVLAQRIQFGWLAPFAVPAGVPDSQAIPLPERLYAGGVNSHRGFPQNQAGPRDPVTGFPLGGNALLLHSTELRFPLLGENIGGVLFHDMGNVYSTIRRISFRVSQRNLEDFDYMVHAVGFGLRYRTPVGPFRADFAYSINPPAFFGLKGTNQELREGTAQRVRQQISHFQFFISIGQAF